MLDWLVAHNFDPTLGKIAAAALIVLLAILAGALFCGGYESRAALYDRERDG